MEGLSIELTNVCNRHCLHCVWREAAPPEFFPLTLAGEILDQAKALGFRTVSLTGGEVALYPHLEEFIALVVDCGFTYSLVTNGHVFRERLLPILSAPGNLEKLKAVCFSLDGARFETHDALRGPGSFREVIEAASNCQHNNIPFSLKTVITNFNKEELADLAFLGAVLGAQAHEFLPLFPSSRLIREDIIPQPAEVRRIVQWIATSLTQTLRTKICVEDYGSPAAFLKCPNIVKCIHLDFRGNQVICCNLSHLAPEEGKIGVFGEEWLADLNEVPLREGIIRHVHGYARLVEERLREFDRLPPLAYEPCYWCFRHFGKLEWLKNFSDSPWAAGVIEEKRCHADE